MKSRTNETSAPERVPDDDRRFDRLVSYEDGDGTVVCDRKNPAAWIRATRLERVRR